MNNEQLLEAFENLEPNRIRTILTEINDKLKDSIKPGGGVGEVTAPRLARCMLFYALYLSDVNRRTKAGRGSNYNAPKWKQVAEELNSFSGSLKSNVSPYQLKVFSENMIAQFATLAARSRGAHGNFFYSTILLFILRLHEKGVFDTEFFRTIALNDDQQLPPDIFRLFEGCLGRVAKPVHETRNQIVNVRFTIEADKARKFSDYFDFFSYGEDGGLHAVIYRPTREAPTTFIKTFLAISPLRAPQDDPPHEHASHAFSHFYFPKHNRHDNSFRFSGGKVLPLEGGVYLVGGQRPSRSDLKRAAFHWTKVLGISWNDINKYHTIFPALVTSTSYDGGHMLASRAAVRLTPIAHSDKQYLGQVALSDLKKDILRDISAEQKAISGLSDDQKQQHYYGNRNRYLHPEENDDYVRRIVTMIQDMTNNSPNKHISWDVPEGYSRIINKKSGKREKLSKARLQTLFGDALPSGEEYVDGNEPFSPFQHLRFGPLCLD